MYKVGEDIKLYVTLRDGYNTSRKQGGDQLRVRIYNSTLNASALGKVIDHNNGSYTIVLRALWPGRQTISVILAYRRETVRSIYYIRQKVNVIENLTKIKRFIYFKFIRLLLVTLLNTNVYIKAFLHSNTSCSLSITGAVYLE